MSPKRNITDIVAEAHRAGWHKDPLGGEILSELAARGKAPKAWIIATAVLGLFTVLSTYSAVTYYVANQTSVEQLQSLRKEKESIAQERSKDSDTHQALLKYEQGKGNDAIRMKSMEIAALEKNVHELARENTRLQAEVEALKNKAAESAATQPSDRPARK